MIHQVQIKNKFIVLFFVVCFLLISCEQDNNVVFDQYHKTQGYWAKEDVKTFVYQVQDTISPSNLFINIRANNNYPYSNLYVIFKMYQPDMTIVVDTLQYQMANAQGELLGDGFTDIKQSKLWLKQDYIFNQSGTYKFTLEQAVRQLGEVKGIDQLPGISEVGLRIEKEK
ncbi:gliding motility lipoprotein GldH [Myroides sp. LJL116]